MHKPDSHGFYDNLVLFLDNRFRPVALYCPCCIRHLWLVSRKTDVRLFTPCSPIQQLHSTGHTTFMSAKLPNEGQKIMNVQMYLTGFLSKPLPVRLPACFAHMSVRQSKASWHISRMSFRTFILPPLSACLPVSRCPDAEVRFINMTALTGGRLRSSFWIVDRKHIYIGSADMDWRSLSKVTTNINNMSVQSKIRTEDNWASAVRRGQVCSSFLASKWLQRSLRNKSKFN